jgi:hypothetical protein
MVFLTLTSINKKIKEIEIKAYIFFIFFFEVVSRASGSAWSLAQASDLAGQQEAPVN